MLRAYKAMLSPVLPNACRFVPTCSEYAQEAITRYGSFRGGLMALWRLLRCHPFSAGGYDPVILRKEPAGTPASVCESRDIHPERMEPAPHELTSTTLCPSVRRC
jgi:putative membrane protein insertion efficiency factor